MGKSVSLNVSELKKLAQSSLTAQAMFEEWASRQRHTTHTDVRRLRVKLLEQGVDVKEAQYLGVFEKLEQMGVGSIVKSATGRPQLFVWGQRVEVVGKTGLGIGAEEEAPEIEVQPAVRMGGAGEIEVYVRIGSKLYRASKLEVVPSEEEKEVRPLERGA